MLQAIPSLLQPCIAQANIKKLYKTTLSQISDQLQWPFICPITRFLVSIIVGDWRDGQSRLKYNQESPPTTTFIIFIRSLH